MWSEAQVSTKATNLELYSISKENFKFQLIPVNIQSRIEPRTAMIKF